MISAVTIIHVTQGNSVRKIGNKDKLKMIVKMEHKIK